MAEPPKDATPIFNGDNLEGWHGHNPHDSVKVPADKIAEAIASYQEAFKTHWTVEKGELVNDGNGPYCTTNKDYGDIEFYLEYKTVALADSGIYLRGTPQVQIWDTTEAGGKWDRNADKGSGGLFNNSKEAPGQLPLVHADKPFGEWNSFKVTQIGARTSVIFNDELVVDNAIMENYWDRDLPLPATGPIHLQTHGGEIRWRNILVREIPIAEATELLRGDDTAQGFSPIFNGKDFSGWAGALDNYEVVDGAIACKEGKGGNIYTEEVYDNYVVRLEFKLTPGGNNGLAIHYPGEGRASTDGLTELQVLDDTADKYKELDLRQYHGSIYGMVPAHRGYLRPVGEWNYQEVTVKGRAIKVELNGSVILDADVADVTEFMDDKEHPGLERTSGHFGFAGHNEPVQFRNIAIKKL